MTIGVAIIGSGIFAKEQHLPAVQACPDLHLVAIYSRSLKSAKALAEEAPDAILYSDDAGTGRGFDDLLAHEDIHALIIGLPIPLQPTFIRKAIAAGKHVLSEKPIAKDVATAAELFEWYQEPDNRQKATWSVAENYRFLDSFEYGAQQVSSMGRLLGFQMKVQRYTTSDGRYYQTPWRKTPEYQGGFLLDGGIHYIAATRLLLGESNKIERLSAFTSQLQPHLPPIDTFNAVLETVSGVSGTFSVSFGTTFSGEEYALACEAGTVVISRGTVVVKRNGNEEKKTFVEETNGVKQEIATWAHGLKNANVDARQIPEEALADLQLLEAIFKSGEQSGAAVSLKK